MRLGDLLGIGRTFDRAHNRSSYTFENTDFTLGKQFLNILVGNLNLPSLDVLKFANLSHLRLVEWFDNEEANALI